MSRAVSPPTARQIAAVARDGNATSIVPRLTLTGHAGFRCQFAGCRRGSTVNCDSRTRLITGCFHKYSLRRLCVEPDVTHRHCELGGAGLPARFFSCLVWCLAK